MGTGVSVGQGYPEQLSGLLGPHYDVANNGIGGSTIADLNNRASTIDSRLNDSPTQNILCVLIGTNDILISGHSGQTTYEDYVNFCTARQLAGWKVLAFTLPSWDNGILGHETDRLSFNNSVVTNWASFADALVDLGADSDIGSGGGIVNKPLFYSDNVHLTSAGYGIIAELVNSAIVGL